MKQNADFMELIRRLISYKSRTVETQPSGLTLADWLISQSVSHQRAHLSPLTGLYQTYWLTGLTDVADQSLISQIGKYKDILYYSKSKSTAFSAVSRRIAPLHCQFFKHSWYHSSSLVNLELSRVVCFAQDEKTRSHSELIAGIAKKSYAICANSGQTDSRCRQ